MVRWVAVAAIVLSCQGGGDAPPRVETGSSAVKPAPIDAAGHTHEVDPEPAALDLRPERRGEPESEGSARAKPDEPERVDAGKQIADLGAVPAWDAVVDRTRYLARRAQQGVVFGTVGPAIMIPAPVAPPTADSGVTKVDAGPKLEIASPYVWLVDDTEGNGALAIRIAFGAHAPAEADRVAVAGAWALDDDHRWYWKAATVTALPAAKSAEAKDPPAAPGHAIASGELPTGARPISLAKDGDAAYFTLVGPPPPSEGDGWPVADELGNPMIALLELPGERASYGAQDLRTADERWQLRRGQTYWVRLGHFHKHGDKPTTVTARTAPMRVK